MSKRLGVALYPPPRTGGDWPWLVVIFWDGTPEAFTYERREDAEAGLAEKTRYLNAVVREGR